MSPTLLSHLYFVLLPEIADGAMVSRKSLAEAVPSTRILPHLIKTPAG